MAKIKRKGGLGRGLSAILPENVEDPEADPVVVATGIGEIPIVQIEMTNPFQPRQEFDEEAMEELADSIRRHGIIQPLTVRKLEQDRYQIIAGERRFRAAQKAGLTCVPAHIRKANDEQLLEMALIENIQREDLNPIEIATTYRRMIDELGLEHESLGERVGKNRATVTNYLRLLKLPAEILAGIKEGEITMGHAKPIMGLEDTSIQLQAYQAIIEREMSVRQAEELCRELKKPGKKNKISKEPTSPQEIQMKYITQQLEHKFGNKIKLKQNSTGKGEISIPFYSNEDLNRILEILDL